MRTLYCAPGALEAAGDGGRSSPEFSGPGTGQRPRVGWGAGVGRLERGCAAHGPPPAKRLVSSGSMPSPSLTLGPPAALCPHRLPCIPATLGACHYNARAACSGGGARHRPGACWLLLASASRCSSRSLRSLATASAAVPTPTCHCGAVKAAARAWGASGTPRGGRLGLSRQGVLGRGPPADATSCPALPSLYRALVARPPTHPPTQPSLWRKAAAGPPSPFQTAPAALPASRRRQPPPPLPPRRPPPPSAASPAPLAACHRRPRPAWPRARAPQRARCPRAPRTAPCQGSTPAAPQATAALGRGRCRRRPAAAAAAGTSLTPPRRRCWCRWPPAAGMRGRTG
jgi:hypothetical protein